MTEFGLDRTDMAAAGAAVTGASQDVRTADGTEALAALASALPGTRTAAYLPDLAELWRAGVREWCDAVDDFAAGVDDLSRDGSATDNLVQDALGGMTFVFGNG